MPKRIYNISKISVNYLIDQLRQRVLLLENPVNPPYFGYREFDANTDLLITDTTLDITAPDVVVTLYDINSVQLTNPIHNIANSSGGVITVNTVNSQTIYLPFGEVETITLEDGESLTIQRTKGYWRSL